MGIDDDALAWRLARNCLLYEEDLGPEQVNIGNTIEPKMVPRHEALRGLYTRLLIEYLDADVARLTALEQRMWHALRERSQPDCSPRLYGALVDGGGAGTPGAFGGEGQREVEETRKCVVDLCQRAATMIRDAGAVEDERCRQRFLAGLAYKNTTDVLGDLPGVPEDSAARLLHRLDELGSD